MCFACCLSKGFTPFKTLLIQFLIYTCFHERNYARISWIPHLFLFFSSLNTVLLSHAWTVLLLTWLAAIGELFFTHSSTILTTARRILGSGDFSIREVRMTWIKFFLISMLMTDNRVFTRSRLSIISSLVTIRTNTWKYSKAGPRQTTEQMHLSVHLSKFSGLQ